jgi:hypothetical protein
MSLSLGLPYVLWSPIIAHATVGCHQMAGTRDYDEGCHPDIQESYIPSPTDTWERTNDPASERCYQYDESEHYHNNNLEEQVPFDPTHNPQRRKRKRKARKKHAQGSKVQQNYVKGRLSNMDRSNIHGVTKVVGGYIQVGSVQVFALFDPSASHSFVSAKLVESYKMMKCPTRRPLLVHSPVGEIPADQVCPKVNLVINKGEFTATLIVLESMDIPVVLGNGWLCAHKGVIQGNQCIVHLTTPSGERIEYQGCPLQSEEDDNNF